MRREGNQTGAALSRRLLAAAAFVLAASFVGAQTAAPQDPATVAPRDHPQWSLSAGYGFSVHLNRGRADEPEVLIVPGYTHPLWGRLEYLAEGHVALYNPGGYMLGVMPVGFRFFVLPDRVTPYLSIGGGIGWTNLEALEEIDRRFNFLLQGSLGVRGKLANGQAWTLEARLDHISNGGTRLPNLGLNNVVFLAGFRFP